MDNEKIELGIKATRQLHELENAWELDKSKILEKLIELAYQNPSEYYYLDTGWVKK